MAILSEKTDWVLEAAGYLMRVGFSEDWEACEHYADCLYQTYVVEDKESGWKARDAVDEDMKYWGEE